MSKTARRKRREAKARMKAIWQEQCQRCGKWFPKDEIIYGPAPFAAEVNGDMTPVSLCNKCHYQSSMDI